MSNKYTKQIISKGAKFNNWTVIEEVKSLCGRKFLCINSDGLKKSVKLCHLKSGASRGLSKEDLSKLSTKHGMQGTRFYTIWQGVKRRCLNKYVLEYKDYGGRGITVCDKWLKFEGFYNDMFSSYKDNLTIDRIDNNGNYYKENCRWATMKEQNNNTRANLVIEFRNKKYKLSELSKKFNINYNTLYGRLFTYNMTIGKAIVKTSYRGKHKR